MPILKLYPHGATAGVAPGPGQGARAKRSTCGGWSHHSIRNNTRFLYSIHSPGLTGSGLSLTLTVRDCPPTHREWERMRRAFVHRLRRLGLIRLHWVTEWQRRRVPHLHGAAWFPGGGQPGGENLPQQILGAWLSVAADCGARPGAQTVKPMYAAIGWFQYVSKHAARGLWHYQRSPEAVPSGWQGATGRMWGYCGDWPRRDATEVELGMAGFWAFRRLVRSWRKADARAAGDRRRIRHARRMLAHSDRAVSSVRGVSQWLELDDQLRLVAAVGAMGHSVES